MNVRLDLQEAAAIAVRWLASGRISIRPADPIPNATLFKQVNTERYRQQHHRSPGRPNRYGLPSVKEIGHTEYVRRWREKKANPYMNHDEPFPTLAELERRHIEAALKRVANNRTHAAKLLGISIRTMRNKINLYKIAGEYSVGEKTNMA